MGDQHNPLNALMSILMVFPIASQWKGTCTDVTDVFDSDGQRLHSLTDWSHLLFRWWQRSFRRRNRLSSQSCTVTDARESSSPEIETYALYWLALDMRMFIGASTYLSCFFKVFSK